MARSLSDYVRDALQIVSEVEPEWVADKPSDWTVLDVREPDEYAEGHIPGALNFPRGFLEVRADHVHEKRDERLQGRKQKLVCVCGGGHRSALAAKTLLEMGFADVVSLRGGMRLWNEQGREVTR